MFLCFALVCKQNVMNICKNSQFWESFTKWKPLKITGALILQRNEDKMKEKAASQMLSWIFKKLCFQLVYYFNNGFACALLSIMCLDVVQLLQRMHDVLLLQLVLAQLELDPCVTKSTQVARLPSIFSQLISNLLCSVALASGVDSRAPLRVCRI